MSIARIGISSSVQGEERLSTSLDNISAVTQAEGLPFVLPNVGVSQACAYAEQLDGLYVTGGGDIDPNLFDEDPHPKLGEITPERDRFEIAIIRAFLQRNKPILAVCRGVQILNIAAGGDMYQDIYAQSEEEKQMLQHMQRAPRNHRSHAILLTPSSKLAELTGVTDGYVNSFHHQAVRELAPGFEATAWASDGTIEAIESMDHAFVVGVQWHPENLLQAKDGMAKRLFLSFVQACRKPNVG
ncbi:gamma-glutamyl-gamma-aminobutyrate hydrolase family protein [Shouchella shacheensis]|uniref:gamma-glutamyl-gamma-aminobutyrate hydrolase family protein n=1 Tax=Shouchella shacheensis TaxID=1649580 RepID=UPI00074050D7|nr:gamma-glutamyl-gamma-aminobutyrate hydrolase family protein [Shouchella shacheensis]